MRVQTDVLDVSLKRHGRGPRHQLLKLIVSVAHLPSRRTWFILAAHPAFLPEALCPDPSEVQEEDPAHPLARRWDCLAHVLRVDESRGSSRDKAILPDLSRKGLFADSPYAELAHFLVVRRMLRRFPVVHHCMDSAGSLRAAAVTALSGDVQSGRVEIALFQHRKKGGKSGGGTGAGGEGLAEMPASLEAARRDMEARFKERVAGQLGISGLLDDSGCAGARQGVQECVQRRLFGVGRLGLAAPSDGPVPVCRRAHPLADRSAGQGLGCGSRTDAACDAAVG